MMRFRSLVLFSALSVVALFLTIALVGCKPAETPREQARSVVLTIAEGVRQGDIACADYARTKKDFSIAYECAAIVAQARETLIAAEDLVDAWDAESAGKLGCSMKSAVAALEQMESAVTKAGAKVPAAVDDAIRLAPLLTGGCNDAG